VVGERQLGRQKIVEEERAEFASTKGRGDSRCDD
jgi:hypothetical protein